MSGWAIDPGATDQYTLVHIANLDGSGKTDVTSATSGLSFGYLRIGDTLVTASGVTLDDLAGADGPHIDWGLIHVSGGDYLLGLPDAAFALPLVPAVKVVGTLANTKIYGLVHPLNSLDEDDLRDTLTILTSPITTVSSQTAIVITDGKNLNDLYNGLIATFFDANWAFSGEAVVKDYVGSTKTLTLHRAPAETITTNHYCQLRQTAFGGVVNLGVI